MTRHLTGTRTHSRLHIPSRDEAHGEKGLGRLLILGAFVPMRSGTRGASFELAHRLRMLGWSVHMASSMVSPAARALDSIDKILRHKTEYDIALIDVYSGRAFVLAELAASLLWTLGKPFILRLHGGGLPQFAVSNERRVRRLFASATKITAPSLFLCDELRKFRSDIVHIPNGIDLALYPFRSRSKLQPRLVWLRAFHSVYNPMMAVEAAEMLVVSTPSISLTMAGPDKGDGSLDLVIREIQSRGMAHLVHLRGPVEKAAVGDTLAEGEIFINTSNVDNAPVTVIEAMAVGLPIVSTNVGGIPMIIDDGENGLLVPASDSRAMAGAIQALLTHGGLASRLSNAGRSTALRHSWEVVLPSWGDLLRASL